MKAYKAFNSDLTCQGFQYELGETYTLRGALSLSTKAYYIENKLQAPFS